MHLYLTPLVELKRANKRGWVQTPAAQIIQQKLKNDVHLVLRAQAFI